MKIPREIASKGEDIAGRGWVVGQVAASAFNGTAGAAGEGNTAIGVQIAQRLISGRPWEMAITVE